MSRRPPLLLALLLLGFPQFVETLYSPALPSSPSTMASLPPRRRDERCHSGSRPSRSAWWRGTLADV